MEDIEFKDIFISLKNNWKFIIGIILVTLLVYANIFRGEFVTADDIPGIVENPMTKNLAASIQTLNINTAKNAIIYAIFGMNPTAYHITSVLIHLVNIVLVYIFALSLFNEKTAKIATAIFALHPVNTEAVAWISASPYAINGTLGLLILTAFILFEKTRSKRYLISSIILYLGMVTHDKGAWALVIPLIILVIDQFIFSEEIKFRTILLYILPFILIAGISAYIVVGKNYSGRVQALTEQYYFDPTQAPPLLNRIPFTLQEAAQYLVFPYELNIYPGEKEISMNQYRTILAIGFALIILMVYLWKTNRIYAGLLFCIMAAVGPTFSPIQIAWLMTERYLYLGSVFFAILIGVLINNINKKQRTKAIYTLIAMLIICSIRVVLRTEDWRTNKNLWISTLKFSPDSYRVYNNLGDVYMKEKNYEKAIENFKKSFEIFPQYADAMHNVAVVYFAQNDMENAKKYLQMAINTKPTLYPAWEKMGVIFLQEGKLEIAELHFKEALKISPNAELAKTGLQTIEAKRREQGIK